MEILIDPKSGFCFGVKRAIEMAESEVTKGDILYCLGEIVHNAEEINRLHSLGIRFIDRSTFYTLSNCKVMIRAHGEPPETYRFAESRNIELIDATCPVVLKLQDRIRNVQNVNPDAQIVIYGKNDHPEVIGLRGQVKKVVIVESPHDTVKVDFTKPVFLFAQTTKDKKIYTEIKKRIIEGLMGSGNSSNDLIVYNSICGQVANRAPWLISFSKTVDTLIFVGGKSSSNSKLLFEVCKRNNQNAYFITTAEETDKFDLATSKRIGITGATSTPSWLIESVANRIREKYIHESN